MPTHVCKELQPLSSCGRISYPFLVQRFILVGYHWSRIYRAETGNVNKKKSKSNIWEMHIAQMEWELARV